MVSLTVEQAKKLASETNFVFAIRLSRWTLRIKVSDILTEIRKAIKAENPSSVFRYWSTGYGGKGTGNPEASVRVYARDASVHSKCVGLGSVKVGNHTLNIVDATEVAVEERTEVRRVICNGVRIDNVECMLSYLRVYIDFDESQVLLSNGDLSVPVDSFKVKLPDSLRIRKSDESEYSIIRFKVSGYNDDELSKLFPDYKNPKTCDDGSVGGWTTADSRKMVICRFCHVPGHDGAEDCPVKRKKLAETRCFKCLKFGHTSTRCPTGIVCFTCRQVGHVKGSPECALSKKGVTTNAWPKPGETAVSKSGTKSSSPTAKSSKIPTARTDETKEPSPTKLDPPVGADSVEQEVSESDTDVSDDENNSVGMPIDDEVDHTEGNKPEGSGLGTEESDPDFTTSSPVGSEDEGETLMSEEDDWQTPKSRKRGRSSRNSSTSSLVSPEAKNQRLGLLGTGVGAIKGWMGYGPRYLSVEDQNTVEQTTVINVPKPNKGMILRSKKGTKTKTVK